MTARQIVGLVVAAAIAAGLAISLGYAFRSGKAAVQAQWDADTLRRTQAAVKAEQDARSKEHALQQAKQKVEERYVETKRKADADAAHAKSELDRLRNALAARDRAARQDPAPASRVDVSGERELLGECAQAVVGLGTTSQRLADKVIGLQSYVKDVCLAQ